MTFQSGAVSLVRFPQSDLTRGKLRPVVLLAQLPGPYEDWLVCALSSRVHARIPDWDEVIEAADEDFPGSGLKLPSLIRLSKLAALHSSILEGVLGRISEVRLRRLLKRLSRFLEGQRPPVL